jgi:hypothetical protein
VERKGPVLWVVGLRRSLDVASDNNGFIGGQVDSVGQLQWTRCMETHSESFTSSRDSSSTSAQGRKWNEECCRWHADVKGKSEGGRSPEAREKVVSGGCQWELGMRPVLSSEARWRCLAGWGMVWKGGTVEAKLAYAIAQ